MVIFPPNIVVTAYPGYFWHMNEKVLYSCKSGVLKRLKPSYPNKFNNVKEVGYHVSYQGYRKFMSVQELKKLVVSDSQFPINSPVQQEFQLN